MSRMYLKTETDFYDAVLEASCEPRAAYDVMDSMTYGAGDRYDIRVLYNPDSNEFAVEGDIETTWIDWRDLRSILSAASDMLYNLPCEGEDGVIRYGGLLAKDIERMEREEE